ncbi:MAG: inositol 2-dehydrogenase [Thermodesulfobacteriota bacterium]
MGSSGIDKVRIGLIGTGRIGCIHAESLSFRLPGADLLCVSDVDVDAAKSCANEFKVGTVYEDYRNILERQDIDAVVISSSTDTHARMIKGAAESGKHIFCEKPIALDLSQIDEALQAVNNAGVKLQVGFNRRFDPNFRKMKELIRSGKIGKPHLLRITSRDPVPPSYEYIKASGGIFLDMTIHDFDMARYLLGDEVTEIFATGAVLVDTKIGDFGDIDTAMITLKFGNGALGSIDNSRKAVYGYDQRVEVLGSEGCAAAFNKTPDQVAISDNQGIHTEKPLYFFIERYRESYIQEMREFIDAVKSDKTPPVGGIDGRISVLIAMAAKKSLEKNRPVRVVM